MTILAFGCSVIHGAETVTPGNNKENCEFSYANLVAKHIGVDCVNSAFCGNSNENAFHQALTAIATCDKITAVIMGWTSEPRETWLCDGRWWQFIPSWAATNRDVWRKYVALEVPHQDMQFCADKGRLMDTLKNIFANISQYKFDLSEYRRKRDNMALALRGYCEHNKIKLIETCWDEPVAGVDINLAEFGDWRNAKPWRHPNKKEHQQIAQAIIEYCKL